MITVIIIMIVIIIINSVEPKRNASPGKRDALFSGLTSVVISGQQHRRTAHRTPHEEKNHTQKQKHTRSFFLLPVQAMAKKVQKVKIAGEVRQQLVGEELGNRNGREQHRDTKGMKKKSA